MNSASRYVLFFAIWTVLCRGGLAAPTNSVMSFPPYHRFTVPQGAAVLGCLTVLGYESVEGFQNAHGITADGIVGPLTWAAIEESLASRGFCFAGCNGPVTLELSQVPQGICVSLSNRTETVLLLKATDVQGAYGPGFTVVLHCRYSGTDTGGRTFLSSKDIQAVMHHGLEIQEHGVIVTNISVVDFAAFDACKVYAECVLASSNQISHVKSNTAIIPGGPALKK